MFPLLIIDKQCTDYIWLQLMSSFPTSCECYRVAGLQARVALQGPGGHECLRTESHHIKSDTCR